MGKIQPPSLFLRVRVRVRRVRRKRRAESGESVVPVHGRVQRVRPASRRAYAGESRPQSRPGDRAAAAATSATSATATSASQPATSASHVGQPASQPATSASQPASHVGQPASQPRRLADDDSHHGHGGWLATWHSHGQRWPWWPCSVVVVASQPASHGHVGWPCWPWSSVATWHGQPTTWPWWPCSVVVLAGCRRWLSCWLATEHDHGQRANTESQYACPQA